MTDPIKAALEAVEKARAAGLALDAFADSIMETHSTVACREGAICLRSLEFHVTRLAERLAAAVEATARDEPNTSPPPETPHE